MSKDILDESTSYRVSKPLLTQLSRRHWWLISSAILALYNVLIAKVIVPYQQGLANSHTGDYGESSLFLIITFIVAVGISVRLFLQRKGWYVLFLVLALSVVYWWPVLSEIECVSCTQGG